jgi:hypothetical protein
MVKSETEVLMDKAKEAAESEDAAIAAWFVQIDRRIAVQEALVDKLMKRYGL